MFDSLVRVSIKGKEIHFSIITGAYRLSSPHPRTRKIDENTPQDATSQPNISPQKKSWWMLEIHSTTKQAVQEIWLTYSSGLLCFPCSSFRYSLTLFSNLFASFNHSTCALLVYHQYLCLEGIYLPLWISIPKYLTIWHCVLSRAGSRQEWESHPLVRPFPRELARDRGRQHLYIPQFVASIRKVIQAHILRSSWYTQLY